MNMASELAIAPPPSSETDSTLDPLRAKLVRYADQAIEALHEVAQNGDKDSARVAAAGSILDRIGLVKPPAPPAPNTLPAEVISAAIAGLGAVFGRSLGVVPTLRDVTPDRPGDRPEAGGAGVGDARAAQAKPGGAVRGGVLAAVASRRGSVLRKKAASRGQQAEP